MRAGCSASGPTSSSARSPSSRRARSSGLIAPGETAILLGGVVAGQGQIDVIALIALVWACAVAGDVTSFLGRRLGRTFLERHGPRLKITEPRLQQVERFFDRHGGKAILLGRFVGLVRAVAPFLAGSSGMRLRRFLPYDIIGAGLWGATFALLGYVFWHSFDQVVAIAKKGALALGTTIAVLVGVAVLVGWLREPENKQRVQAWLDVQAQRPLVRPVVALFAPVVRGSRGPARFVWGRVTPGDLGLELTTLFAVFGVGAFTFAGYMVVINENLRQTVGEARALRHRPPPAHRRGHRRSQSGDGARRLARSGDTADRGRGLPRRAPAPARGHRAAGRHGADDEQRSAPPRRSRAGRGRWTRSSTRWATAIPRGTPPTPCSGWPWRSPCATRSPPGHSGGADRRGPAGRRGRGPDADLPARALPVRRPRRRRAVQRGIRTLRDLRAGHRPPAADGRPQPDA